MANFSDLTRREQVLAYLQERRNQWVDGPELATEVVGGSEGLRRLRELRLSGDHDIRERRHPDAQRDIWQYMLVVMEHITPSRINRLDFGLPDFDDAKPAYPKERPVEVVPDPPEPEPTPSPWPADHDQTKISTAIKRKEDGTFEYVPPQRTLVGEQLEIPPDPPQPEGGKFTSMPTKLIWGEMVICPRCRQKTTRGRKPKPKDDSAVPEHIRQRKAKAAAKEGPTLIDADGVLLYRDPTSDKPKPCERCNGYGIVPNQGPISMPRLSDA